MLSYILIFLTLFKVQQKDLNIIIYHEESKLNEPEFKVNIYSKSDTVVFMNRVDINLLSSKFRNETVTFEFFIFTDTLIFSNVEISPFLLPPSINLVTLNVDSAVPLEYRHSTTSLYKKISLFCRFSCALCSAEYIFVKEE